MQRGLRSMCPKDKYGGKEMTEQKLQELLGSRQYPALKEALLELMQDQDLVNISVTAICEAADVNRSTFYNYYTSPADLLMETEQDFLDLIPTPPDVLDKQNQEALLAANAEFFDFIQSNRKAIRTLFSDSSGSSFTSRLVDHLCNGYIFIEDNSDELTARFKSLYIANGTVGMLKEWVNEDSPISSETLAEMMYSISRTISQ